MTHTPTPWTAKDRRGRPRPFVWAENATEEYRRVGAPVANCEQFDAAGEDEANAAFIVMACNAYDPLIEAANQALEALDIHPAKTNGFAPQQSKIRAAAKRKLRDAIAQAKGGKEGE